MEIVDTRYRKVDTESSMTSSPYFQNRIVYFHWVKISEEGFPQVEK
jgi:hypothetical protein